jgi:hypothetical protein
LSVVSAHPLRIVVAVSRIACVVDENKWRDEACSKQNENVAEQIRVVRDCTIASSLSEFDVVFYIVDLLSLSLSNINKAMHDFTRNSS